MQNTIIIPTIIISIIILPLYLPLLLFFYIYRQIIHTYLKVKYKSRLVLLDSADTFWTVGENHQNQSYIFTLLKDKTDSDIITEIKTVMENKLLKHPEIYSKVLCSLHFLAGYPFYIKEFYNSEDFITTINVSKYTHLATICDIINYLSVTPLPKNNKVLWEVIVIKATDDWKHQNNIRNNQIPVILRVNHSITDGVSMMNLIANSFGDKTVDLSIYLKNIPKTPDENCLLKFFKGLFMLFIVSGYVVVQGFRIKCDRKLWKAPRLFNKQNVAYKCDESGELVEEIKVLKKSIGSSFTEILIASVSEALYNYFLKHNDINSIPDSALLLVVATKNLKPLTVNGIPVLRNQFGMVNFNLPINIGAKSMLQRIEILQKKIKPLLHSFLPLVNSFILFNLMSLFPTYVIQKLFPMIETVGISNLPGFPKIEMCNGYEVEDIFFFLPQRDTNGIGFSVLTYNDRLHFGLTADEASIPCKSDCNEIVDDFFNNIKKLRLEVDKKYQEQSVVNLD